MPKAWSAKDERMYEHVKESEKSRGSKRAKEIAARTVNKQRKEEGRTKSQAGSSTSRGRSKSAGSEKSSKSSHGRSHSGRKSSKPTRAHNRSRSRKSSSSR